MKKFLFLLLTAVTVLIISCGDDDKKENPVCNNKCDVVGATRCAADGKGFDKCTKETDTCNVWKKTECSGEEVCVKVGDVAGCGTNGGDDNVTDCSKDANACAANTNGKTECKEGVCSTPESQNVTECTEFGNECANNTNGKTECSEVQGITGCTYPACETDGCYKTKCLGDTLAVCVEDDTNKCLKYVKTDCSADNKVCYSDDGVVPSCVSNQNVTDCTEFGNECANNTNGKTECSEVQGITGCTYPACETDGCYKTKCLGDTLAVCVEDDTNRCLKYVKTDCSADNKVCYSDDGVVPSCVSN